MHRVLYQWACMAGVLVCAGLLGCQREHIDQADEPKTSSKISTLKESVSQSVMGQLASPLIPYNIEHASSGQPRLKTENPSGLADAVAARQ